MVTEETDRLIGERRIRMMAILHDRIHVAKAVNVKVITLDEGPQGYKDFDKGASTKYVIDPNGMLVH